MSCTQNTGKWCALTGTGNPFSTRWLATALKQRRLSRDVTPGIEWLLTQGRRMGVSANLTSELNYLWRSRAGELSEQNDLFRLTCALEIAYLPRRAGAAAPDSISVLRPKRCWRASKSASSSRRIAGPWLSTRRFSQSPISAPWQGP